MLGTKALKFCFIFCDFRLAMLIMNVSFIWCFYFSHFRWFGAFAFLILDGLAEVSDILVLKWGAWHLIHNDRITLFYNQRLKCSLKFAYTDK